VVLRLWGGWVEDEARREVVLGGMVEASPSPLGGVEDELAGVAGWLLEAAGAGPGPGTNGSWVTPREFVHPPGTGRGRRRRTQWQRTAGRFN